MSGSSVHCFRRSRWSSHQSHGVFEPRESSASLTTPRAIPYFRDEMCTCCSKQCKTAIIDAHRYYVQYFAHVVGAQHAVQRNSRHRPGLLQRGGCGGRSSLIQVVVSHSSQQHSPLVHSHKAIKYSCLLSCSGHFQQQLPSLQQRLLGAAAGCASRPSRCTWYRVRAMLPKACLCACCRVQSLAPLAPRRQCASNTHAETHCIH